MLPGEEKITEKEGSFAFYRLRAKKVTIATEKFPDDTQLRYTSVKHYG